MCCRQDAATQSGTAIEPAAGGVHRHALDAGLSNSLAKAVCESDPPPWGYRPAYVDKDLAWFCSACDSSGRAHGSDEPSVAPERLAPTRGY